MMLKNQVENILYTIKEDNEEVRNFYNRYLFHIYTSLNFSDYVLERIKLMNHLVKEGIKPDFSLFDSLVNNLKFNRNDE